MMYSFIPILLIVLALATHSYAAFCSGSPADGERESSLPIFDQDLKFVRQVKNAKLYTAGPTGATFPIVHVYGTPYEVGFAQGTIQKKAIIEFVTKTWSYLTTELVDAFPSDFLSPEAKAVIVQKGMDGALDWTRKVTAPFTPQAYLDELQGLADATGLSYDLLYRLNMFPELTKASCSFFGAWGSAVKLEGHTYQLRALDYDVDGPFKDYPQVTIYHPSEGHAYAQVGWPGNVGVLTGFSSQQIAISEIGVSYPDDSFGQGTDNTPPEKVKGEPWMFLLRDVLQFEDSLAGAKTRITNTERTCNLIIGVGDGEDEIVNGLQYSGRVANFYDDTNMIPVNDTWHFHVEDTVYNGMDWLCPSFTGKLGNQLQKYHGAIHEDVIVKNILPTVQTGNLHIAVYDLKESNMHVSFCRSTSAPTTEPHYAYERQFTRLHMNAIFAEPAPLL